MSVFGSSATVQPMPVSSAAVFCADIGGSFMKFGLSHEPGCAIRSEKVATPANSWPDFVASLKALVERNRESVSLDTPLALSLAGLIDPQTGKATSANIPCVNGRALADEFSAVLGRPVIAANDADCFALAEANAGAGRGHRVVFCAIIGTGIGGGLVVDGHLVRGAGGVTGEWGHGPIVNTTIDFGTGEPALYIPRFACGCGQSGCVDTIGGARGLERLHRFLHDADLDSHAILSGWQDGEAKAARTVGAYIQLVADPLSLTVNVTGASIVPVGGGLASATPLITALDLAVRKRILNRATGSLVVPAIKREDGGLIGAAILGHQRAMS